jgi:hypothetical protein
LRHPKRELRAFLGFLLQPTQSNLDAIRNRPFVAHPSTRLCHPGQFLTQDFKQFLLCHNVRPNRTIINSCRLQHPRAQLVVFQERCLLPLQFNTVPASALQLLVYVWNACLAPSSQTIVSLADSHRCNTDIITRAWFERASMVRQPTRSAATWARVIIEMTIVAIGRIARTITHSEWVHNVMVDPSNALLHNCPRLYMVGGCRKVSWFVRAVPVRVGRVTGSGLRGCARTFYHWALACATWTCSIRVSTYPRFVWLKYDSGARACTPPRA